MTFGPIWVQSRGKKTRWYEKQRKKKKRGTDANVFQFIPIAGTLTEFIVSIYGQNAPWRTSLALRLFLQSMKQICIWDLAFAAFPSTIMSAARAFPIAVQQQIVAVSCGRLLVWCSVCISSRKAVTLGWTLFPVRMRQGCVRTWLSVRLCFWLIPPFLRLPLIGILVHITLFNQRQRSSD